MRPLLPPHVGWPLLVVALLLTGIGASVATLIFSRADGGAQVVDDYYAQAAHWGEAMAEQAASQRLGWQAEAVLEPTPAGSALRPVVLTVRDAEGAPVEGLQGTVRLSRPQQSRAQAEIPLQAVAGQPGTYRQALPMGAAGLWDLTVTARRDTLRYRHTLRLDVP